MFHRFNRFAGPSAVMLVSFGVLISAEAQSTRGELAGNVADPTGVTVSGATITATNEATGGKNVAISTSVGAYRFTALPIGTYTVTATAPASRRPATPACWCRSTAPLRSTLRCSSARSLMS